MEQPSRITRTHGLLLFFAIFGLVALVIYSFSSQYRVENKTPLPVKTTENKVVGGGIDVNQYKLRLENSLITVPDTNVKISLVEGRASYGTSAFDGGDVTFVKLLGGVRINENLSHIFADIAVQSGGTGIFHYITLFEVSNDTITHLSSHFVGDRIEMIEATTTPLNSRSYPLSIRYLDRDIDQSMVEEPTIPKDIIIEVRNGIFVEKSL